MQSCGGEELLTQDNDTGRLSKDEKAGSSVFVHVSAAAAGTCPEGPVLPRESVSAWVPCRDGVDV